MGHAFKADLTMLKIHFQNDEEALLAHPPDDGGVTLL